MIARLKVESVVHGGEALARHEGRVVFVRGAAPGDVVEAELTGEGRFEHARALRVVERGELRVDAPCPIVDRCGGCPLQHVSYEAQLAAKEELTADALERIGGFARGSYELRPIVASPSKFGYRRRAAMHRGGFLQARSSVVTPVDECLLFEPLLQDLASLVRDALEVRLLAGSRSGAIDVRGMSRKRAERLLESRVIGGVIADGVVLGDPVVVDPPLANGARLRLRPDTFAQANRSMVPLLQEAVVQAVGGAARLLELFCGSGTLTLPLLGSRQVTAVESAGPSLALLRRSADEAGLAVKLIAGDAVDVARGFDEPVDAILLDPPRTGAAEVVRFLKAPRVVYVSCDAPTLARDGKLLAAAGYRLMSATPMDLFPQTAHFEIVATFVRDA
ncbi:MAG: class I SAM-dependent RNA methyltransferase [Myxococcales bacterium]|nr:TRAM domain-containing protein [Myxococcales bacterium]